ncbi:MAG: hypothetical protein ACE5HU_00535 [Acidobacteriota bacterium]
MDRHKQGRLDTGFQRGPERIAYHLPCHLKAQNIGFKSRDLLGLILGAEVKTIDRCSGVDGTRGFQEAVFRPRLESRLVPDGRHRGGQAGSRRL